MRPGPRCSSVIAIAPDSPLILEYASAAPVHTFSWRQRTLRIGLGALDAAFNAPTMCISEVPGFAKHTSTPHSAAMAQMAVAPVTLALSMVFIRARIKRDCGARDERFNVKKRSVCYLRHPNTREKNPPLLDSDCDGTSVFVGEFAETSPLFTFPPSSFVLNNP